MEWAVPLPVSWVAVDCSGGWEHQFPATDTEQALLRDAAWLPLVEIGPLRRDTRSLLRQLKSVSGPSFCIHTLPGGFHPLVSCACQLFLQ